MKKEIFRILLIIIYFKLIKAYQNYFLLININKEIKIIF